MDTAIKYPLPDRVKPQFVIFDIHALWRSTLSVKGLAEDALYIYPYGNNGPQRVKDLSISVGQTFGQNIIWRHSIHAGGIHLSAWHGPSRWSQ